MSEEVRKEIKEELNEKPEEGKPAPAEDLSGPEGDHLSPIVVTELKQPMSVWGIGPVFGLIAIGLTVAAILLRDKWIFESGIPESEVLRYIYIGFGCLLILAAIVMYWKAVFGIRIDSFIQSGKVCKAGIYGWTRNPIYAAILFACTGALFISGNTYMYVLPILFWILLTILLKKTEEADMIKRFDDEYLDYMVNVNRIFPKPPAR